MSETEVGQTHDEPASSSPPPPASIWVGKIILAAIIVAGTLFSIQSAWQQFDRPRIGIDDANITFVYARNLAHGHGFVYYPGGERVEGCTSLLYALLCTVFFRINDHPEAAILFMQGLMMFASVWLAARIAGEMDRPNRQGISPWQIFLAAVVFASPAFVIWNSIALMDTCLWTLLLNAAMWLCLSETASSDSKLRAVAKCLLIAAIVLCRPEGFMLAPAVVTMLAFACRAKLGTWTLALKSVRAAFITFVVAAVGVTIFRILYFGYPLPNTYYAKVEPDKLRSLYHGFVYLGEFLEAYWLAAAAVFLTACGALIFLRPTIAEVGDSETQTTDAADPMQYVKFVIASFLLCAGLLLPTPGGGDHFASFRFYQPIWPWCALPVIFCVRKAINRLLTKRSLRAAGHWFIALVLGAAVWAINPIDWHSLAESTAPLPHEFDLAKNGRETGEAMNTIFAANPPSVGVLLAGGFGMTYYGPMIDLLGLNTVAMGHSNNDRTGLKNHAAFDHDVFWKLKPAVVYPVFMPSAPDDSIGGMVYGFANAMMKDEPTSREFQDHYFITIVRPGEGSALAASNPNFCLAGYFDANTIALIRQAGFRAKVVRVKVN